MRVRDLPLPIYVFFLTECVVFALLVAWLILALFVVTPEALPKRVNVGYVGLPYVS